MGVPSPLALPLTLTLLLLSLGIQAVGADPHLTPATQAVLRGDVAEFTCRTSNTQWTVMTLSLNDKSVLTIYNQTGPLPSPTNNPVTARPLSPELPRKGWVFSLNTTAMQDEAKVTCELQGIGQDTANLSVQEKGSVQLVGGDKVAFKDQQVEFQCRAPGWRPKPSLEWQVGNEKVSPGNLSISKASTGYFTATSSLQVMAVRSSKVTCLAWVSVHKEQPESSDVRLTVVMEVQEDKCTVPLAVTASLLAILLLLFLLVGGGAALWFRRRARGTSSSQQRTGLGPPSSTGGPASKDPVRWRVNAGFSDEEPTDAANNEQNMESGCQTGSQMDSVGIGEVPDVVSSSNLSLHHDSRAQLSLENSTNIRMITTV